MSKQYNNEFSSFNGSLAHLSKEQLESYRLGITFAINSLKVSKQELETTIVNLDKLLTAVLQLQRNRK